MRIGPLQSDGLLCFWLISGMGNSESAKKKQQRKVLLKQMEKDAQKTRPFETKNILFLHKSNATQLKIVYNFRNALIAKTGSTFAITEFVNIAEECEFPHTLSWLNKLNSVVLICLTCDAIDQFRKIILKKGFADENGFLHSKVFTISFGESLSSMWPPKGLKKGSTDLRDFHFGFSDIENIRPQDFERSLRLNSLVAAIKVTG